jgi:hypothetical protein
MYLSRFSLASGTWVQSVTRLIPAGKNAPIDYSPLLGIPALNLTLRFDLRPERSEILVVASAPEKYEAILHGAVTAWCGKISETNITVEPSEGAAMRDAWMDGAPPIRVRAGSTYKAGGVPLLCSYLIFPNLEEILAAAAAANTRLVFQVSGLKSPLNEKEVGALRKQIVRLSYVEHIPPLLLRQQERAAKRLPDEPWMIEESLAVESAADLHRLEALISEDFGLTYARLGFPAIALGPEEDGSVDEFFSTGFAGSILNGETAHNLSGARLRQNELESLTQLAMPTKDEPEPDHLPADGRSDGASFDVFISYSSRDRQTAFALCHLLEQGGYRCWIAPRDIKPGQLWPEAIPQGIRASKLMVVIFSESSNLSRQVLREIERAVHYGITIIPFRIEDVPMTDAMSYLLAVPHWFDAITPPMEKQLVRLATEIRTQLGEPATRPPSFPEAKN